MGQRSGHWNLATLWEVGGEEEGGGEVLQELPAWLGGGWRPQDRVLGPLLMTLHTAQLAWSASPEAPRGRLLGNPYPATPRLPAVGVSSAAFSHQGHCWEQGTTGSHRFQPNPQQYKHNIRSDYESTGRILLLSLTGASRFKTGNQENKGPYLSGVSK